jgi:hypothetical protein
MRFGLGCAAAAAGLLCLHGAARAQYSSVVNPGAGSGSERCTTGGSFTATGGNQAAAQDGGNCATGGNYSGLTSIVQLFADSQAYETGDATTLTRVQDDQDTLWQARTGAGVFAIGREAGNASTFGYVPGATGGTYASVLGTLANASLYLPSSFVADLNTYYPGLNQNKNGDIKTNTDGGNGVGEYTAQGIPNFLAFSGLTSPFRFAIFSNGSTLWTSNAVSNSDGHDHMVTWQLSNAYLTAHNETMYIASFEDSSFPGGDGDFNDYTFVFLNINPVSEPAPLAVLPLGMATLLYGRRRLKHAQHDAGAQKRSKH